MRTASESIRTLLAENIRSYRRSKNLSQEELAEKCSLHRTYIGSVERCERNVTLSTLELLASALEISVAELLSNRTFPETENLRSNKVATTL